MMKWMRLLLFTIPTLLLLSCGGGANDDPGPDRVVVLALEFSETSGDIDSIVEVDMAKDLFTTSGFLTVRVGSILPDVDNTVRTVRLDRYNVSFERTSDGPNLERFSVPIGGVTITSDSGSTNLEEEAELNVGIMTVEDKLFSAFAQDFYASGGGEVNFNVTIEVVGTNLAGDTVRGQTTFLMRAAIFEPFDDLIPNILSLTQSPNFTVGQPFSVSWTITLNPNNRGIVSFPISQATLVTPWGEALDIPPSLFPVGGVTLDTNIIADNNLLLPGQEEDFPATRLIVQNAYGIDEEAASSVVTITRSQNPVTQGIPLNIDRFSPDRTEVVLG